MSPIVVTGIDPGLVDTGIVSFRFEVNLCQIFVSWNVQTRQPAIAIARTAAMLHSPVYVNYIFIEGYRPRSHLNTDAKMTALVHDLHQLLPDAKVLNNTGIKKVVKPRLLELLNVDMFPVATHHGDLVSAARIAVLGMLKDPDLNRLLVKVVSATLTQSRWQVTVL